MRGCIAACALLLMGIEVAHAQQTDTTATAAPVIQTAPRGAFMNIGFDGLVDFGTSTAKNVTGLQRGDHDPRVRGFTIPNAEISLDAAVDPYFKGFANIVYKLDEVGESGVELEEAYFLTTSLPHNLQLKGGQFFTEFGRQNPQHPHSWSFVDQPIVLNRMFGPDGLRGPGARLSWLAPTPWYTEVMVTALNSIGETAFSFRSPESAEIHGGETVEDSLGLNGLILVPRLATSFDLSETQTIVIGASAAFGPNNSAENARTRIFGGDLYYKWKPSTSRQGFPFVSWQSEVLHRNYETAAAEPLSDTGWYSQLLWGIEPRKIAGIRVDHADGSESSFQSEIRTRRLRVSPNFTWYPTEFSKVRLQYNYDDRTDIGKDHSVWLQFEFIMGAHAAHKF